VILACFDLETTGTDTATAEVVQAACVISRDGVDESDKALFRPLWSTPIPAEATAVHGITDEMVADAPIFGMCAESLADGLLEADVLLTFNGLGYDVPILERYLGRPLAHSCHVDVYRLWLRAQAQDWTNPAVGIPATLLRGSLGAAYYWCLGDVLTGAHDALNDVRATMSVAQILRMHTPAPDMNYDPAWRWAELARLSQAPLPGFADLDGKLRWSGPDLVFTFGKCKGQSLRTCDRSYLRWLVGADFPGDVKRIVRDVLAGQHPTPEAM
jgi:DNA polymerase-3 subunit epsilon